MVFLGIYIDGKAWHKRLTLLSFFFFSERRHDGQDIYFYLYILVMSLPKQYFVTLIRKHAVIQLPRLMPMLPKHRLTL